MAGKSINELPEITSVSDSSLMALSSDGKTLGRVAARTLKNSVVGQHISNYIRYINQDIKLELNDGTLTLKAGSKVYVPNGFESDGTTPKFDVVAVPTDINYTAGYNDTRMLFVQGSNHSGMDGFPVSQCYSGTTAPTGSTYLYWYDTTNNIIKRTIDGGSTWDSNDYSLPICIITGGSSVVSSLDQVFNGFGYIGSTIFALPGTVVSMPNGKEENGVLKNTEVEITSVRTVTLGSTSTTEYFGYLSPTGIDYMLATNYYESAIPPTNKNGYAMWLNTQDNRFYVKNFSVSGSAWELVDALGNICKFTTSSGKITKFESKSVLSLLDTNTFNLVPHIVETFDNGTSWYRLWSDGYIEQGGYAAQPGAAVEAYHTVTFLKPFRNNLYYIFLTSGVGMSGWQYANGASIGYGYQPDRNVFAGTASMQLSNAVGDGNVPLFWECKGYAAE